MNKTSKRIVMLCLCSLLMLQSLYCTGCCRIIAEVAALKHETYEPSAMIPPERFFIGTRINLEFTASFPPAFLIMIWGFPLEVAADLLLLPFDAIYYSCYLAKPPLSLLVEKHQNDRLEIFLKMGMDPNKIDYRYDDYLTPLKIAYQKNNSMAAKLLLEYGAKVNAKDVFILKGGGDYGHEKNKVALYVLRSEIPKEMTQEWEAKFLVSKWVQLWIERRLAHKSDEHDGTLEFEVVSLLLKHGFPVNNISNDQKTLLDDLLAENRLALEDKDKMVSLLRSYNAKTYMELAKENASLPMP